MKATRWFLLGTGMLCTALWLDAAPAAVPIRGLHLMAPKSEEIPLAVRFIKEALPKEGVNVLVLEFDYRFQFRKRPEVAERNRRRQRLRDHKRRLRHLANNNLVFDLKSIPAEIWLVGAAVEDLANNTLAPAQLIVWQGSLDRPRFPALSCQQQPSGNAAEFPP